MRRNWKMHAIAITVICVIVLALYLAMGTPKPAAPPITGDRVIQVTTATWGLNCNEAIEQANSQLTQGAHEEGNTENPSLAKPLAPVKQDNVLSVLGQRCDNQVTCSFDVSSDALGGVEPMDACFKHLTVGYRCFAYDRLSTLDVEQGNTLTIDCSQPAANGPTPAHQ